MPDHSAEIPQYGPRDVIRALERLPALCEGLTNLYYSFSNKLDRLERAIKMAEDVTSQLSDLATAYEGIYTEAQTLISDAEAYYNDHDSTVAEIEAKYAADEATLAGLQPYLDRLTAAKNNIAASMASAMAVVTPQPTPPTTPPATDGSSTDAPSGAAPDAAALPAAGPDDSAAQTTGTGVAG